MWEWLLSPIDAMRAHEVGFNTAWHARLMVLGWGVLIPLGVLAARFFKIMPGQSWPERVDNQAWWVAHRVLQYLGVALSAVALWLIFGEARGGLHRLLGWSALALMLVQVLGGLLRGTKGGPTELAPDGTPRGDHYDMTRRRLIFEYCHKYLGYVALLVAMAAILTGLWQANGPIWMWLSLALWWGLLIGLFRALQRRGMAVDTYQAIWGPGAEHPGNQRDPIGFGVRKPGGETRHQMAEGDAGLTPPG